MKTIPKEIKEQVLARVREGKNSVAEIASQHGIKVNTVYLWINKGLGWVDATTLENNKLRKENRELKELLGSLLLTIARGKKTRHGLTSDQQI